jgi:2'-5' RNA ligase
MFGEMLLDRIELMKSDLSAKGARYSILQSFPLGWVTCPQRSPA